jgi:hypothetical protein
MNAPAPLHIVWRDSNRRDCWEHVHPDVLHVPHGFAGHPYWMVFTPYPGGNDRVENPTLRASYDGLVWTNVREVPEPIIPAPDNPETHHADPDLVYHGGRIHLVYATAHKKTREISFSVVNSPDALHWSEPRVFHHEIGAESPACQVDENRWHLWFIRMNPQKHSGPSQLFHRWGPDLTQLEYERQCQLEIPGHILWHIDVQRVPNGYEALVAAFPKGMDPSRTRLFHAFSKDGQSFTLSSDGAILEPSRLGWDNRMIYRSTFLKKSDGTYRIWYSAASWGLHFGIGYLEGPLNSLMAPISAPCVSVPRYTTRLLGEVRERIIYEAHHLLTVPVLSLALRLRRRT